MTGFSHPRDNHAGRTVQDAVYGCFELIIYTADEATNRIGFNLQGFNGFFFYHTGILPKNNLI